MRRMPILQQEWKVGFAPVVKEEPREITINSVFVTDAEIERCLDNMDRSKYPDKRKVGYVTLYKRRNEMPVFEAKLDEDTTLYDLLKLFWIVDDYSDFCNKCENGDIKVYDFVKCRGCKIPDFDDNKFLYSKSTIKNQYRTHMRLLLKIFKKECQFHFFREKTKVK